MKMFKKLMLIAAAAMAFTGCANDGADTFDGAKVKVQFSAGEATTRTAFGEPTENSYPTLWTGGESIKIGLNNASDSSTVSATATAVEGGKAATWTAEIEDDGSGSYTLYALCPASAYLSTRANGWGVTIPNTQTPSENSCDEAAQIIVSKSATTDALPTTVDMDFTHVTAYGCFSLKNLELGSATISSVALTAEVGFAGRWNYDFESASLTENNSSTSITINTDKTENIWFACAPGNLAGTVLTVVVNTDMGTFTKEIEMPDGCEFKAGHIARFAINMEGVSIVGPVIYNKLTDVADLTPGDMVIIAATNSKLAISTTQNNNNRAQTAITKSEDGSYITDPSSDVQVFTVENGTIVGSYAFNTGSGYIYAASSSSNYLRTETTLSTNSSWDVTVDSGVATIKAKGTNTRNWLRYNSGSSIFSCYASGQADVSIYYINVEVAILDTPVVTATANGESEINVSWNAIENAGSYEVTCGNLSQTVEGTECTFTGLSHSTTYTITVTAIPADASAYIKSVAGTATATTATPAVVYYYVPVTTVTAGGKYLIVADNNGTYCAATPVATSKTYDYLQKTEVNVTDNGIVSTSAVDALAFTINASATEGAYNIIDSNNKYIYQNNTKYSNFNVSATNPTSGADWTIEIGADGLATITNSTVDKWMQYSTNYSSYGIYNTTSGILPQLYMLQE